MLSAAPYRSPIDFEDDATWPECLKAALDKCRGAFAAEQQADEILAHEMLLGFHCTRLLPYEATEVLEGGLCPPSPTFLAQRISRARDAGYLSADICARLLAENQAADANRMGAICFVSMRSYLMEESKVCRFFESWGGEALYNSHEDDPGTGPTLRCLGEPYIVTASRPVNKLEEFQYGLARYFANRLFNSTTRGVACKPELYETRVRGPVPSEGVVKLVSFKDPTFESMTHCHTERWNLCGTGGHG